MYTNEQTISQTTHQTKTLPHPSHYRHTLHGHFHFPLLCHCNSPWLLHRMECMHWIELRILQLLYQKWRKILLRRMGKRSWNLWTIHWHMQMERRKLHLMRRAIQSWNDPICHLSYLPSWYHHCGMHASQEPIPSKSTIIWSFHGKLCLNFKKQPLNQLILYSIDHNCSNFI